jgi:ornithine cyclodeaminase/alanine dehydrogenase-like protein (mu-crystallin family)
LVQVSNFVDNSIHFWSQLPKVPELLYLAHADVAAAAPPLAEIIEAVALALTEKAHGRVLLPPKHTLHPYPGTLLQAMPAWVEAAHAAGLKWVSAFPQNKQRGLPALTGLIIVNDPETGLPEAIMDAAWITAARTGAATAVAARALARSDSQTLGLLGAGVQARANVAALKQVLSKLGRVVVYAPRTETVEVFRREVSAEHGLDVQAVSSPEQAVREADVMVTATTWPRMNSEPPILPEWLKPGVFASVVDLDASWTGAAVAQFGRRFTDDLPTMAVAREKGTFRGWPEAEDLGRVIAGMRPGRQNGEERILTVILGLGIYDVVVARRVVDEARRRGIGITLPS